jgi:hypothetical protein
MPNKGNKMTDESKYIQLIEDYFDEHYTKTTGVAQEWVLRKENRTIHNVAVMAVEALKEHLK